MKRPKMHISPTHNGQIGTILADWEAGRMVVIDYSSIPNPESFKETLERHINARLKEERRKAEITIH